MCGICGKLNFADEVTVKRDSIVAMMDTMRHRGPDEEGVYLSSAVGLGHLRLSIIDLSTGQQPMSNEDGTVWVAFNGEIYNYKELRSFLISKGHQLRTNSDTEVLVHLYEEFGEGSVEKLYGMFAYAIWDEKNRALLLARDRVGIKPLYYTITPEGLLFASEIKALLADPAYKPEIDLAALDRFLTFLYTPGEETIFRGIKKLLPGHYLAVKNGQVRQRRYWDLSLAEPGAFKSESAYAEELTALLEQVVREHMIADVPVGVLLSGGVDSTAMLSFATEQTDQPVSTFTIGFDSPGCTDERPYARLAAERYGSQHYDTTINAQNFLDSLPQYVWHMEEPVCEPPAIALYHVTKMAREHVTVLLSGEGGDEAFAGYQNYRNLCWLESAKRALGPLNGAVAGLMSAAAHLPGLARVGKYAPLMHTPFESYYYSRTADPYQSFNGIKGELYTPDFKHAAGINGAGRQGFVSGLLGGVNGAGLLNKMLYVDTKTWLPDDLLIKADKMTMANSLELRVPLLDHRVLEFAAALPRNLKLHGLTTKYLFKKAMVRRIPEPIIRRKKTGFPVPYQRWIANDFRGTIREVLLDRRSLERGYFERRAVERLLGGPDAGHGNHPKELFSLLVLELWHRTFLDPHPAAKMAQVSLDTQLVRG